ncbi:MAG TPA: nitrilase-related carbon-nitrogen hydrolase, partial [Verrucomicrobiota bacterium]|nr:nitrilase-related carbon-nitrogen hydrolase [Verrucomicrobiota bacterium]
PVAFEMERRPPEGHGSETDVPRGGSETGAPIRVKTSVLICFEDVFPYVVRDYVDEDTDFLVNLTNDGWFGNSAEQWQHAATAVFRSVENNVSLLRSCNNGLTCWIDSRGRLREILRDDDGSIYGPAVATWSIPTLGEGSIRERTFYNRHGDWFGWTSVVVAFGACVRRIFRKQHGDA